MGVLMNLRGWLPYFIIVAVVLGVVGAVVYNVFPRQRTDENGSKDLSSVDVPILYQSIVDDFTLEFRGIDGLKAMINELNADFIFRAFWKRQQEPSTYEVLKQVITELKSTKEDLLIIGALPAQTLWRNDYDFDNDKELTYPQTWELGSGSNQVGGKYL